MTIEATQAQTEDSLTVADLIYKAINQLDGGTEAEVLQLASKWCGKQLNMADFKAALDSFE